jgi:hypothetical protein
VVLSRALVAFDERRANPSANLGTLGSAGDVVWTGTRVLTPLTAAFVFLPEVAGNRLTVPDSGDFSPSDSLQIDWDFTPAALGTVATRNLVSHWGASGNRAWRLVTTGTVVSFAWSADGAATVSSPTVLYATLGLVNGTRNRGRMIWRANNGSGNWDVRWYTVAADGTATLVETDTGSGTSSIFNSSAVIEIGSEGGSGAGVPASGDIHDIALTVDTVQELDVDTSVLTDMTATSFTATTGQTVTINRSTGATYKTEVVLPGIPSRILNGTSDYGEVADLAGLDFGASDSFTVWALVQQWPNYNRGEMVYKRTTAALGVGYGLFNWDDGNDYFRISDGTVGVQDLQTRGADATGGLRLVAGVRDVTADTINVFQNGTATTATTDTTTGSLANALALRFGAAVSGPTRFTGRLFAWGIHPYAMTSAQLTALRTALINGTDPGSGPRTVDLSVPTRTADLSIPTRTLELTA